MIDIKKGLDGVVVDTTKVSKVMQETNSLTYRGYAVQALCEHKNFEQVAHALLLGELPNDAELAAFNQEERSGRKLSKAVLALITSMPEQAHPMDIVRSAVSLIGCHDCEGLTKDFETNLKAAKNLYAKLPTIVAAIQRHKKGQAPIEPKDTLGYSENFFYMCFGEVPEPEIIKCFDISMILYAEHSFNASTFAARVITSTESDFYSAICGAIGALKGPLHGGANEAVMHVLKEIEQPENAESWLEQALVEKRKIMGFGHRVYKNGDSRVPTMTKAYHAMCDIKGETKWRAISQTLADTMIAKKGIHPNLDFPAGPAYYLMGFDIDLFTPIFIMSRITGWAAHIFEQQAANRIIRPLSAYEGAEQRSVPA